MPTTIHVPDALLSAVDRHARELGMSRNRFIVRALERAIEEETSWSPAFLEELEKARKDRDSHETVERMAKEIAARRTRKKPPRL